MFAAQRRNRTMFDAALTQLALIYHLTVYNLRSKDRNPVIGLLMVALQSVIMIAGFMGMFWIMGVRRSPLRGDFMLYTMTGIFLFQAHTMAVMAVAGSSGSVSPMMKHGPMNTAVWITSSALAALYRTIFAGGVILGLYWLWSPYRIEDPIGSMAMLLLAWLSGAAMGLVFLAIKPWSPKAAMLGSTIYSRIQMIASGKMFVANALPAYMLHYFDWNPLFHVIDQLRGDVFINYTPHHSSESYPIFFTLVVLMIGLMGEFVTRNAESISWSAAR